MHKRVPSKWGDKEDGMVAVFQPEWTGVEFMKNIGFELISDEGGYSKYGNVKGYVGESYGKMIANKITVYFNHTYNPEQDLVFVGIKDDWDSRTCYNGVCRNPEFLKELIKNAR